MILCKRTSALKVGRGCLVFFPFDSEINQLACQVPGLRYSNTFRKCLDAWSQLLEEFTTVGYSHMPHHKSITANHEAFTSRIPLYLFITYLTIRGSKKSLANCNHSFHGLMIGIHHTHYAYHLGRLAVCISSSSSRLGWWISTYNGIFTFFECGLAHLLWFFFFGFSSSILWCCNS